MKYLLCRVDATENVHGIRSSEMWPAIVESESSNAEHILTEYLNSRHPNYIGKYDYYVVPMDGAVTVSFRPKREYEVTVTPVV